MIGQARDAKKHAVQRSSAIYMMVAATIAAVVLAAHLLPAGGGDAWLRGALFDVAHVVGFAAVAALASVAARHEAAARGISREALQTAVIVALLGLAAVSESAQYFTARDASIGDLLRDASGIVAGVLAALSLRRRGTGRAALLVLAAACLAAGLAGPAGKAVAVVVARLEPRGGASFSNAFADRLLERRNARIEFVSAPSGWSGGSVVRVTPTSSDDAGFTYHGLPRDWSAYRALSFTVATERAAPNALMLRVEGSLIGRFRRRRSRLIVPVTTVPREISIPISEIAASSRPGAFDFENVYGVSVLATDAEDSAFLVGDFRLE